MAHQCDIYKQKDLLKDEMTPRVKDRGLGPSLCLENAAKAAFLRQYQGTSP